MNGCLATQGLEALPTHPPIGGSVSINRKSSNRIDLSRLGQDLFDI